MKDVKKAENVSEPEKEKNARMTITKEQAKYWFSVAKKDIAEGNREGAWNVYRWLSENNAWFHAKQLRKALVNTA
ncbi:MAG: hypothetical protein JSW28_02485 [Thermoplasmata archaeon]|nr:MAG: hypothetical protein JSW28_02485 [Thermoplasmata archaeon]